MPYDLKKDFHEPLRSLSRTSAGLREEPVMTEHETFWFRVIVIGGILVAVITLFCMYTERV